MSSTHAIHSALSALDGASVWINSEPLTADGLREGRRSKSRVDHSCLGPHVVVLPARRGERGLNATWNSTA